MVNHTMVRVGSLRAREFELNEVGMCAASSHRTQDPNQAASASYRPYLLQRNLTGGRCPVPTIVERRSARGSSWFCVESSSRCGRLSDEAIAGDMDPQHGVEVKGLEPSASTLRT
jgi:hypothetical protein